jgi:hypothetical protein
MGLPQTLTGQFIFSLHPNNNQTLYMKLPENNMIVTIPSLIAAGIATAVVKGGITVTAVYLTAGNPDVVTGDQIKTEGGLHILELGHMEPWAIAMMCATLLIGMGTCGACCHKRGKKLRQGQRGQAQRPGTRQSERAGAYGRPRRGQAIGGRPDISRHAQRDRGPEDASDNAAAHRGKACREAVRQPAMRRVHKTKTCSRWLQQQQAKADNLLRK